MRSVRERPKPDSLGFSSQFLTFVKCTIPDVTDHSVKVAGDALHKTSKLSLALLGQFQIENCFRNLARELGVTPHGRGFYPLAEALVKDLGLPRSLVVELNVPALIRNSLHCNGIHHGYQERDTVTTLGDVTYKFRHKQTVSCAAVEHVAHALEWSIGILATIFGTPAVRALEEVRDQYVSERAATKPQ